MNKLVLFFVLALSALCCNRSSGTILECGGGGEFACPAGMYCQLAEECGGVDEKGVCKPVPADCSTEESLVCGCNHRTYSNECMANAAKVSVDYGGNCIEIKDDKNEEKGKKFDFPDTKHDIDPSAVENAGDREVEKFEDSAF